MLLNKQIKKVEKINYSIKVQNNVLGNINNSEEDKIKFVKHWKLINM